MVRFYYLGLLVVFLWFFCGGIGHFVVPEFFLSITPPYVPWPLAVVYVSGVLEILGATGILFPQVRQLAGNCLILLTLAVTPANIHMSLNPELYPFVTDWQLNLRLVVQVLLLVCIWWSTRDRRWV
jgi:uncharacterized membrane protein